MTASDKTTVAKILGLSKALQYLNTDNKKVKEICAEIDGLAEGLLATPEQTEKIVERVIEKPEWWRPYLINTSTDDHITVQRPNTTYTEITCGLNDIMVMEGVTT